MTNEESAVEVVNTEIVEQPKDIVPAERQVAMNPLDLPVEVFGAALERRGQNRERLMKWIKEALVPGVDYGKIHIVGKDKCPKGKYCDNPAHFSKDVLFKPGAEKICGMLGVAVTFPNLHKYEEAAYSGIEINQIILRCELVDGSGQVIASGVGSRSVKQDYGDINKALKMAEKSGHIDATIRIGGISDLFTQDVEDMVPQSYSESVSPAEHETPPTEQKPHSAPKAAARTDVSDKPWPIGKHKGEKISVVPTQYLEWCLDNLDPSKGPAYNLAKAELARRDAQVPAEDDLPTPLPGRADLLDQAIKAEAQLVERGLLTVETINGMRKQYTSKAALEDCNEMQIRNYLTTLNKMLEE